MPGDTFKIERGYYKVSEYTGILGNVNEQSFLINLVNRGEVKRNSRGFTAYPSDPLIGWTIMDFGPFYIPKRTTVIEMNYRTMLLYKNVIEWEQKQQISYNEGKVYLGKNEIKRYRFLKNYYFMVGDNVANSRDSRYWGLLPEEFIVGKASWIGVSRNINTGKIRWNRVGKRIE